jgi:hypothetical protein
MAKQLTARSVIHHNEQTFQPGKPIKLEGGNSDENRALAQHWIDIGVAVVTDDPESLLPGGPSVAPGMDVDAEVAKSSDREFAMKNSHVTGTQQLLPEDVQLGVDEGSDEKQPAPELDALKDLSAADKKALAALSDEDRAKLAELNQG